MTMDYDYNEWTRPEVKAEIEAERQASAPPPTPPAPTKQQVVESINKPGVNPNLAPDALKDLPYETTGEIVNVIRTTNPDKFVVQMQLKDTLPGEYRPVYLNKEQILALGGEIPLERNWKPGGGQKTEQSEKKRKEKEAKAEKEKEPEIDLKDYVLVGTQTKKPEYIKKTDAERIKKESPTLYDQLKRDGVSAYNQSVKTEERLAAARLQDYEIRLSEALKEAATKQSIADFIMESEALNKAHASDKEMAALQKLEEYKAKGGGYYVEQYIRDTGDVKTLADAGFDIAEFKKVAETAMLFHKNTSERKEAERVYNALIQYEKKSPTLMSRTDTVTPSTSYKENTDDDYIAKMQAVLTKAGVPKEAQTVMMAGAVATASTPVPGDELLWVLGIAAAIGTIASINVISDYVERNKKVPTTENTVVITPSGNIKPMSGVVIEVPKTGWIPENVGGAIERKSTSLVPPSMATYRGSELVPPSIKKEMEQIIGKKNTVVLLDDPAITPEQLSGVVGGMIEASAAKKAVVDTIPVDYNKLLKDAKTKDLDKTFELINQGIKRYGGTATPVNKQQVKEYELYRNAYTEYLRKMAILDAAWHSYVASVNPSPINGKLDKDIVEKLALYQLSRYIKGKSKSKTASLTTFKEYFANSPDLRQIMMVYDQTLTKAMAKGLTQTQAQNKANTMLQNMLKDKTKASTRTATQTATKTATLVTPAVRTGEATKTAELTQTKPIVKTAALTAAGTATKVKKGKGKTEKKDWTPEDIKSAIAWRDGIVVHAIRSPYRRGVDEKSYNVEKLPAGLTVMENYGGRGSQQRSAKVTGQFPKRLTVDVGNQDVIITKQKGNRVSMRHMRDTRGSRSMSTISKKKGRIYHTRAGGGVILSRRAMKGY